MKREITLFSNMTLRTRLFFSYLIILALSLAISTLALLLFLSSQPVPPSYTWRQLEVVLPALSQDIAQNIEQNRRNILTFSTLLDDFAVTNDIRVMMVSLDGTAEGTVMHDTDGTYLEDTTVELRLEANYRPQPKSDEDKSDSNRIRNTPPLRQTNIEIGFGQFENPDDSNWVYAGIYWRNPPRAGNRPETIALLVADERTGKSLQSVLNEFGSSFLVPLLQAGLVGGIIAFVLAFFTARSIARPLQRLVQATSSVGRGEYTEHVPETGPREMRQVAGSFNHMTAEVRAAQKSQRDFLANVSHDLKTPLTSIQGYSQAIMDGAAPNPSHAAGIIHDEAARLNRMVTELTDLARLQAGRLSMRMQPLEIHEILEAIDYRLNVVAQQKHITLHVDTHQLPVVAGDGDRLVQVFTNIVGNAIKYTPEGGQVWVKSNVRNGGVEVTVEDNGIGISQQDLPRMFERFFQADRSRGPQRGTGLGLAITKEIVEAHGGTINITSEGEGKGTTVAIWLPSPNASTVVNRSLI